MASISSKLMPPLFRKHGEPQLPLSREEGEKLLSLALGFKFNRLGPTRGGKAYSRHDREAFAERHPTIPKNAVLVSVDFESLSWLPSLHPLYGKITEVESAFFDCRKADEHQSWEWVGEDVTAKHYIVGEYAHIRLISMTGVVIHYTPPTSLPTARSTTPAPETKYRTIILIAHAFENEDNYLRHQLEISYSDVDVYAVIDTQILLCGKRQRPPGLRELLVNRYGIMPETLHNGANDAVYTVAMVLFHAVDKEDNWKLTPTRWLANLKMRIEKEAGVGAAKNDLEKALEKLTVEGPTIQTIERTAHAPDTDPAKDAERIRAARLARLGGGAAQKLGI
ncbi:hypothetical protein BU16DRAFT_567708 [Lophium mytilinum]|uniref:Gfd2/YDR514C-like C-terminal domain-containing protein n=1 Tax=Lophium mytilinum TaxID=390894 RepID=A0A6A6QAW1_9PEZI|nr:hypothetical protein BU16DRAFT_567708 [Lophium mytilinum]